MRVSTQTGFYESGVERRHDNHCDRVSSPSGIRLSNSCPRVEDKILPAIVGLLRSIRQRKEIAVVSLVVGIHHMIGNGFMIYASASWRPITSCNLSLNTGVSR